MAQQFAKLEAKHRTFIERQHVFFTASAAAGARINLSPRSTQSLRIVDDNAVIYLDHTGSGNETAAHMKADGRLTIMMCSFAGPPLIMRLYGRGTILHRDSAAFRQPLREWFNNEAPLGARQIVRLDFDLVQTSCGFGVPKMDYVAERDNLQRWAENKGEDGIRDWWREQNQTSIDGLPTGILSDQ